MNGAELDSIKKLKYADINNELSTLYTKFSNNILSDEENYTTFLSENELSGLSESFINTIKNESIRLGKNDKFAISNTGDSLSGWAMNFAWGYFLIKLIIFSRENASWTTQEPSQSFIFLPVFLIKYLPRFLSGANIIFSFFGIELMTFFALLEVQTIVLKDFISAEQFIYVTILC